MTTIGIIILAVVGLTLWVGYIVLTEEDNE